MNLYINAITVILNNPQGVKNNIKKIRNKKAIKVEKAVVKKDQKLVLSVLEVTFSKVVLIISN